MLLAFASMIFGAVAFFVSALMALALFMRAVGHVLRGRHKLAGMHMALGAACLAILAVCYGLFASQPVVWPWAPLHEGLWVVHALVASSFIAYIPLSRMVHIFAVPAGRLLESQQELLAAKIRAVGLGLMGR